MSSLNFSIDPTKREKTIADRGIDLVDMIALYDGRPVYSYPSPRNGEDRMVTVGEWQGKAYAVVWMERDGVIRLITARRAWTKEERLLERFRETER